MILEDFIKELEKINITISSEALEKLNKYYNLLVETNKYINLTAITEEKDVYLKHFYDSLTTIKVINLDKNIDICDLGTGAGFPGIVLKIVFPKIKLTLVDSLAKRCKFLEEVVKELNLTNTKVECKRIEEYSKENIEKHDILITRAVAKTSIILELGLQALKIKGNFILLKGNIEEELKNIKLVEKELKVKLNKQEEFLLPVENSKRTILVFKKEVSTPVKYPRDFAKIKKIPL